MRLGKTIAGLRSLLLAAAILAPAVVLAVLGLRAHRAESLLLRERFKQDQRAMARLVASRVTEAAGKALRDLEARCDSARPGALLEARFTSAHPLARNIFVLDGAGLVYPPHAPRPDGGSSRPAARDPYLLASDLDVKKYVSRLREGRRRSRLVSRGLQAEHQKDLVAARKLYLRAAGGQSDPAARALLGLARVAHHGGDAGGAGASYGELRKRFAGRRDSEDVSYALLADAGMATLSGVAGMLSLKELHQRLLEGKYNTSPASRRFFLRWVLDRLGSREPVDRARFIALRRATRRFYAAERFGALLWRHGLKELRRQAPEKMSSLALSPEAILVLRRKGQRVVGYAVNEAHLQRQVRQARLHAPPGRAVELRVLRPGQRAAFPEARVVYSSALEAPLSHWTLTGVLPSTAALDTEQQRGRLLRLGLVLGLILVLVSGMVMAYRGVRRETELARLKSDFASNVSHELKTPLTSIRMYAEMLQHGIAETPEDQSRYHSVIVRESERLGRLIANVLDFSKLERGERRYALEPTSLVAMTEEAVETYRRLSERDGVTISLRCGDEDYPEVLADREAAEQCILNLLSNAAKYAPDDPAIEVALSRGDGEVGVTVEDRGMGIPAAEQRRIFDDFYRAPGAARAGVEGTGLGLALVRRHMKACEGRVALRSKPGEGSRFTLWFKAVTPEEQT